MELPWQYIVPASLTVALAMLTAHWAPMSESRHVLVRYTWGVAWIVLAMLGLGFLAPESTLQAGLVALLIFVAVAGAATAAAYVLDNLMQFERRAERAERMLDGDRADVS